MSCISCEKGDYDTSIIFWCICRQLLLSICLTCQQSSHWWCELGSHEQREPCDWTGCWEWYRYESFLPGDVHTR